MFWSFRQNADSQPVYDFSFIPPQLEKTATHLSSRMLIVHCNSCAYTECHTNPFEHYFFWIPPPPPSHQPVYLPTRYDKDCVSSRFAKGKRKPYLEQSLEHGLLTHLGEHGQTAGKTNKHHASRVSHAAVCLSAVSSREMKRRSKHSGPYHQQGNKLMTDTAVFHLISHPTGWEQMFESHENMTAWAPPFCAQQSVSVMSQTWLDCLEKVMQLCVHQQLVHMAWLQHDGALL